MRIPTWRLILTGAAITVLAVGGIGLTSAAGSPGGRATVAAPEGTTAPEDVPGDTDRIHARDRDRLLAEDTDLAPARLRYLRRHLVHAEITVTDRDGNLVQLQADHGTIQAVGATSLTIAEAGGGAVTVALNGDTIIRLGRDAGTTADLKIGAEVFVRSVVDDGAAVAHRVVIVPATTD